VCVCVCVHVRAHVCMSKGGGMRVCRVAEYRIFI